MHRVFSPRQFAGLFVPATTDRQISRLFTFEFGLLRTKLLEVQGCTPSIKGNYTASSRPFCSCHSSDTHCGGCCRFWAALWNTEWDSCEGTVYCRTQCSRDFSVSESIRDETSRHISSSLNWPLYWMKLQQALPIFTRMEIRNVRLFNNYLAAQCIISKSSTALRPDTSDLNSVVRNPVTDFPRSIALLVTHIRCMSG